MSAKKNTTTPAARHAIQQAAAAALAMNRLGLHEQAEAIWTASKLALCAANAKEIAA